MQRERLTPERIRRFACPAGATQAFLWDTESPRLAVRATPGAKSFVFEAKLERRTIRRTIGDTRAWAIEDARAEANRLLVLIDSGTDPRELERERQAEKAAAKAAIEAAARQANERARYTLAALCDAYVRYLEGRGKARSAGATRSAFKCHVTSHPEIAATPAREVTPEHLAELVRAVHQAGKERTAGKLRSYLFAAFNAAKRAPFDPAMPAELIPFGVAHNPCDAIPAIPVAAGNRTLSADELRAYLSHLGDAPPDVALRVALLAGGQRMAQLLRATPADFDPESKTLRLFDPKGKRKTPRVHSLPLAPKAAALVDGLLEHAEATGSPWLFAARGGRPMSFETPGKRAAEIAAAMGGEPFDLQDLRRTVETMLAELGVSRDTRAQLLSHGTSGVQATHYDRHAYTEEKRAALVAWESRLTEIETGKKRANVIAFPHEAKA